MAIASTRVKESYGQKDSLRARIEYTFDSGSKLVYGPFLADDSVKIEQRITDLREYALNKQIVRDAKEAVDKGILTAYGEANADEVAAEWVKRGIEEGDVLVAYNLLKDVMPRYVGRTNAQYSELFGISLEEVSRLLSKWNLLSRNSVIITAYATIGFE